MFSPAVTPTQRLNCSKASICHYNIACLWKISAAELHHLEVTLNNLLRKIWSLPQRCHTGILHSVANLPSIHTKCMYNLVVSHSKKLSLLVCRSPSSLLSDIFTQCQSLAYTSRGYNMLYGHRHLKSYSDQDVEWHQHS